MIDYIIIKFKRTDGVEDGWLSDRWLSVECLVY
jgi:hypothetical protein